MKLCALLMVCVTVAMVTGDEDLADIKVCLKGKDVVIITDVRAADEGQTLDLLNFFGRLAGRCEVDDTQYYISSYPTVLFNHRTGEGITTSRFVHLVNQIPGAQSFIKSAIIERGPHPDINIALRDADKLLDSGSSTLRRHAEKVVLMFSFDKYISPDESSEEIDEALETPSKVHMFELGEALKKHAQVLMFAIGGFDNIYGLYDLASCHDEKCLFQIDTFKELSEEQLFRNCTQL